MNNNYYPYQNTIYQNEDDERLGFVFPFLLGGVTGAAVAPAFWRPNGYTRPNNYYQPPMYPPPYYGPFYR